MKIAQTSLTLSDQGYGYGMKVFLHLQIQNLSNPISQVWHIVGSCD